MCLKKQPVSKNKNNIYSFTLKLYSNFYQLPFTFLSIALDQVKYAKAYLRHCQTFMMEHFCEIVIRF